MRGPGRGTVRFELVGPIAPSDVVGVSRRLYSLLEGCPADLIVCDVGRIGRADLAAIDALARVRLAARRCGRDVIVTRACTELRDLLGLAGLADVLPVDDLRVEAGWEPEKREEPRSLEEEGDPRDLPL